jgi:O-antigen/teichoic acid export membrane protein
MGAANTSLHLTSGRLLARNTIWNIVGQLLPMAVGVVAVPPLVRWLGVDRFGLLSLAWIVIGYFSLFDLGMGRALTKLVSDKLGSDDEESIPPLVWTSLLLLLLLGVVGGLVMLAISGWLVHTALRVPRELQAETLTAFELLAASIPVVTVTSGLRGILEAQQRFGVLNFIRIPTGAFSFAGPLLVLPFSRNLIPVIIVLILGRLIGCMAHLVACLHSLPALRKNFVFQRGVVVPLVRFGGWMTVTNVIGPIMSYLDRFLVGGLLSVSAVAYYTAPFDLISRLTFIPAALTGVLFPAFAVSLIQDSSRTALLFGRGNKYVFLAMFPIILVAISFAPEGLRFWLGADFAQHSELVLRILALGVFTNSLAFVPFALIQGAGRPNVTAKLHLLELPLYLAAVWLLTKRLGITGTALAWTGRVLVDTVLLFVLAHRVLPHKSGLLTKVAGAVAAASAVFYVVTIFRDPTVKIGFDLLALLLFGLATWFWGMAPSERALLPWIRGRRALRVEEQGTPKVVS